jgi:hypothetical protein
LVVNVAASQIDADSLPVRISIWAAVVTLIAVSAFLHSQPSPPDDLLRLKDEAAQELRQAMLRRWEDDPVWRSVNEDGRLPVRWRLADPRYFPANAKPDPAGAGDDPPGSGSVDLTLCEVWLNRAASHRLVLLGEAGSGKTELLIGIYRSLLLAWEEGERVPVLVPIASWSPDRQRLRPWLADWLRMNYRFLGQRLPDSARRTLAEVLLDDGFLAIILDGFDELAPEFRSRAVQELNDLDDQRYVLLSSRIEEYETAVKPVRNTVNLFKNAQGVIVLPQQPDQVLDYLKRRSFAEDRWNEVERALPDRDDLAEVLRTPLMVMLADSIYNRSPLPGTASAPSPRNLVSIRGHGALADHLLAGFLPARYPRTTDHPDPVRGRGWTSAAAARWLGHLARMLGEHTDLKWWDLRVSVSRSGHHRVAVLAITPLMVLAWTAVSAGVLNGWVFSSVAIGVTDAVRISVAALICYFAMLYLSGSYGGAILSVLGAYIAGTLSGSYDLAVGVGLVAGFSWRPLTLRRVGLRHALLVGAAVVAVSMSIRGLGGMLPIPLQVDLTQGFAAGAVDGFTSRWDDDLNGWVGSGTVAAIIAWAGMQVTPPAAAAPTRTRSAVCSRPIVHGLIAGLLVAAFNSWADGFSPDVVHAWMIGPADGLAVGLAVWYVSFWASELSWSRRAYTVPRVRRRWLPAWSTRPLFVSALMALVTTGLNIMGHSSRTDIQVGWARALSEGISVGLLIWFALDYRRPPAATAARDPMMRSLPLLVHLRLAAPAVVVAIVVGLLDSLSAHVARGVSTGIGIGLVVLFWSYRKNGHTKPESESEDSGSWRVDPLEAGVFATVLVGITAGFGYGLMYGLVAGLASRVSRDISRRSEPSFEVLPSLQGAAGGALLGSVVVFAAAFNGIPPLWLAVVGVTSGFAFAFAFGVRGEEPSASLVTSPRRLFEQDRTAFTVTATLIALALGVAVGARTLAGDQPVHVGVMAALSTVLTYGLTAGIVVAASATRFWTFTLSRTWLAAKGDLPWRLMAFLHDAHMNRGVLRSSGAVYQFRHLQLQQRIAVAERPAAQPPSQD